MLSKRNVCLSLTVALTGVLVAGNGVHANPAKAVMPVSASFGAEQSMLHSQSDNNGRQLAMASPKVAKVEISQEAANEKQIAEFTDAVSVSARRLSKEGAKQLATLTRWFAVFWKQNFTTPTMTPAVAPAISRSEMQTYKGQVMRSVTPKHPLWLLSDGRMKTVTAH